MKCIFSTLYGIIGINYAIESCKCFLVIQRLLVIFTKIDRVFTFLLAKFASSLRIIFFLFEQRDTEVIQVIDILGSLQLCAYFATSRDTLSLRNTQSFTMVMQLFFPSSPRTDYVSFIKSFIEDITWLDIFRACVLCSTLLSLSLLVNYVIRQRR